MHRRGSEAVRNNGDREDKMCALTAETESELADWELGRDEDIFCFALEISYISIFPHYYFILCMLTFLAMALCRYAPMRGLN